MNNISQHPCLKNHYMIKEICNPLQKLGVTFFGYTALDAEGNAFCLGSKPDYAEEYLRRHSVKKDILIHPKSTKQSEYDFWDFQDLDADQSELYQMAADFDQNHTLSITQQFDSKSHSFHFSGRLVDDGLNQRMLNKMDCLHAFVDSFKGKLNDIPELNEVYQHATSVDKSLISNQRPIHYVKGKSRSINLESVGKETLNFSSIDYLTKNERDCLRWLMLGKSAEMIAQIKQVSRKTIERHIAAIKEKFGCYTLFQIGSYLVDSGLSEFL